MIQAVIFDSDGTLVDSEVIGMDVVYEIAVAQGIELTREAAHQKFRGVRMASVVRWIAEQLPQGGPQFEADLMQRIRETSTDRFARGIDLMPGARELVSQLNVPFCVATNGPREKIEQTLQLTGLRPLFGDRVYCAYEVGHFKPDPGLFLHAAAALQQKPENCAVVEDSLAGIQAGLAAGMLVYTVHPPQGLPPDEASRVTFVHNLVELKMLWKQLLKSDEANF